MGGAAVGGIALAAIVCIIPGWQPTLVSTSAMSWTVASESSTLYAEIIARNSAKRCGAFAPVAARSKMSKVTRDGSIPCRAARAAQSAHR